MKKNVSAIIVSAGIGTRMGKADPKQFLELDGKPILYYTLKNFNDADCVQNVILVTLAPYIHYCQEDIVNKYGLHKVRAVVSGGKTRQESVYEGLKRVCKDTDLVLVHDGVRPFSRKALIEKIVMASHKCAAVAAVPVINTIKQANADGLVCKTFDRNSLWSIQTPQAIPYGVFLAAHEKAKEDGFAATDDVSLAEYIGYPVKIVEGEDDNIKITTPRDLVAAEQILKTRSD
jgi:2-C-methyl-D-erythritol 4-phosphate cytidylyltransferase